MPGTKQEKRRSDAPGDATERRRGRAPGIRLIGAGVLRSASALAASRPQKRGHCVAPLHTIHPVESTAPGSAERVACARCHKTHAGGHVVNDPRKSATGETWAWTVRRHLFCDHCGHIQSWTEDCTADGQPNGGQPRRVRFTRDPRKIDLFLRAHPRATGVLQT